MAQGHMPSIQIEHIVNAGYTTIALLAHGVHDESKMEEFVEHLSLVPDGESFQTFPPQLASIRRVLKECIAKGGGLDVSKLCGRSSVKTPAMSTVLSPYYRYMRRFHIYPKLSHIPGHLNVIADALSRFQQPLPTPLKQNDFCNVDWKALLEPSPVVIAQTGRKWPSHLGISMQKVEPAVRRLFSSIDFLLGELLAPAGRFSLGVAYNSPPIGSTCWQPRLWVCSPWLVCPFFGLSILIRFGLCYSWTCW